MNPPLSRSPAHRLPIILPLCNLHHPPSPKSNNTTQINKTIASWTNATKTLFFSFFGRIRLLLQHYVIRYAFGSNIIPPIDTTIAGKVLDCGCGPGTWVMVSLLSIITNDMVLLCFTLF